MLIEGLGRSAEKIAKTVITANDVAELGAVKPIGFGSLVRKRRFSDTDPCETNELRSSAFSKANRWLNLFGKQKTEENPYLSLKYNEVSKECSEFLYDYGITPGAWKEAVPEQRMDMQKKAAQIMSKELSFPEEWTNSIELVAVHGEENKALAKCEVNHLSGGGIDVLGVPAIEVDVDHCTDDYFEAMYDIYHEMIHIKQLASVNRLSPTAATDPRLLDLINYFETGSPDHTSKVNYLSSPPEAEARVQALYFEQMLHAVVQERNL